jgi:hypothetical protein
MEKKDNITYLREQRDAYRDKASKVKDKLSIEHYSFMKIADSYERDLKQAEKDAPKTVKPKRLTREERSHARKMCNDYEERAGKIEDKTSEEYINAMKLARYFERELTEDDKRQTTAKAH